MVDSLQNSKTEKLTCRNFSASELLDTWSFGQWSSENTEALDDLLRSLRRKKGFGLFFVQCSPAQSTKIIQVIQKGFPNKTVVQFKGNRQTETLYNKLKDSYQSVPYDIACITGIEEALYEYEDTKRLAGWTSQEIYNYSWKGTPELLNHLNRLREKFAENLPIAIVFFIPRFVVDYFVQRAPDFFDWRSGLFRFFESLKKLQKISGLLVDNKYDEYLKLTPEKRLSKILQIKEIILQFDLLDDKKKANLFREQGRLFHSGDDITQALECYNKSLDLQPKDYRVWNNRGVIFMDLNEYQKSLDDFETSLKINENYYYAWNNRGLALVYLQRYQEGLESFDKALKIEPDYYLPWMNKAYLLFDLGFYEESIKSCEFALSIQSNIYNAWAVKGSALANLQLYEEAIESFDRALELRADDEFALKSKENILQIQEQHASAFEQCKPPVFEQRLDVNQGFLIGPFEAINIDTKGI